MVELLLRLKVDVHALNSDGEAPIHVVARMGRENLISSMADAGANMRHQKSNGDAPLHVAIQHSTEKNQRESLVRELINCRTQGAMVLGALVLQLNYNNETPAMLAIDKDYEKVLEVMLDATMDINVRWPDETNDPIIHRCVRDNRMRCFLLLVIRGADINALNIEGDTALHVLAQHRDYNKQAKTLLEYGANITTLNNNKEIAYDLALRNKHYKVAELIKSNPVGTEVVPKPAEVENPAESEEPEKAKKPTKPKKPKKPKESKKTEEPTETEEPEKTEELSDLEPENSEESLDLEPETTKPPKLTTPIKVPRIKTKGKGVNNKRNQQKVRLHPSGAICRLSDINVEIMSPPNAVQNKKHGCNIRVKKWNFDDDDKVADFKPASNVYELLPHGTVFEEDIMVKFPLELDELYDANSLNVLYSDTVAQQKAAWQPIDDATKSKAATCMFWDGDCYVNRHHFCQIFVKEEVRSEKAVIPLTALLFVQSDPEKNTTKLIVTCTSTDAKSKANVEKKYGCSAVDDQPLLLYQNGKHLQFALKYNNEVWTSQNNTEFLDKALFCTADLSNLNDYNSTPHVTFYIELKKSCEIRQSEVSVVISQKLQHKLGRRDVHKSYFALKWKYNNEATTSAVSPHTVFTDQRKSKTSLTLLNMITPISDNTTLTPVNLVEPDCLPLMDLSIVGIGLGGRGVVDKPCTPLQFVLDRDFRQFLKPVIQTLNKDEEKLREMATSLGMVINGGDDNTLSAQFVLDAWIMRQNGRYKDNELQIWVDFLTLLKAHNCTESVEHLILALEKQRLKLCVSHFMKYLKESEKICQNLFYKDLIFEDQYMDVKNCRSEFERVEFFIIKVILKASSDAFNAFKQELLKSKQKELLNHFISNYV